MISATLFHLEGNLSPADLEHVGRLSGFSTEPILKPVSTANEGLSTKV